MWFKIFTGLKALSIQIERNKIVSVSFHPQIISSVSQDVKEQNFCQEIKKQIQEYYQGKRKAFTLAFEMKGTSFQKRVWKEIQKIPYGQTRTYFDLAQTLKTSARAIGQGCKSNPLPIIIPCHRVVGKNSLGGFSGGLPYKKFLLSLEKKS